MLLRIHPPTRLTVDTMLAKHCQLAICFLIICLAQSVSDAKNAKEQLQCWKAQTWLDKKERVISVQQGPSYAGGFWYWQTEYCTVNQTSCYGLAMHIICPWSEYIHKRNGCFNESVLEYVKHEAQM